ncbi:nitric oxide synthase, inducible isoform X2 [Lingula anatina]|uniref:Nitric oxide synthase n=2 Tax=Lingula anatina TaxID=7574 RepID=A0A1S3JTL2_LINAN|nr:nitric oxide synthase, inducible isoform X2 [Lingula anatina]|eukprot:XP_013413682.1 nitric oxide synthase, inducible isoform X2 [Lingula anatina]
MKKLVLKNYSHGTATRDSLHQDAKQSICPMASICTGAFVIKPSTVPPQEATDRNNDQIQVEALDFIDQYYCHLNRKDSEEHLQRKVVVAQAIQDTGTYHIEYDELVFGAKTAWRNASRCSGRIQWKNLQVFDAREIQTAEEMFRAICHHLTWATNGGNIRSAMTVFPARTNKKKDFRIWNSQFIRYAGYRMPGGHIIGDPSNLSFTQICERLGWKGKGGHFDVLPLVLSANGEPPELFEIPKEIILEVELTHPRFDWFKELGLKWYAVPVVSNMLFDCGGLEFPAAPFNGWYMGTEIGARNLCDVQRYNILEIVGQRMGLDCRSSVNLWKDLALVEVNIAVLHSYQKAGVSIVDHHTVADSFVQFMLQEAKTRGGCPADWVWIVPPISGSITPVFHQEMVNYTIKPSFDYQEDPPLLLLNQLDKEKNMKNLVFGIFRAVLLASKLKMKIRKCRPKCLILFASETGKSEQFARRLEATMGRAFNARTVCMEDYPVNSFLQEQLVLVVTSTFGLGSPPLNGETFFRALESFEKNLSNIRFAVFGLGSKAYPRFCAFAVHIDNLLRNLGGQRMTSLVKADSLSGQEKPFVKWSRQVYNEACALYGLLTFKHADDIEVTTEWHEERFRYTVVGKEEDIIKGLSEIHGYQMQSFNIISSTNLQAKSSGLRSLSVKLQSTTNKDKLVYQHGDHMLIFPTNNIAMVTAIIQRIKDLPLCGAAVQLETFSVKHNAWGSHPRLPPCTIQMALLHYLDITKPPTQDMLKGLAQLATNNKEHNRLITLAKNEEAYLQWRDYKMPTIVDVLSEFQSIQLPVAFLLSQLPILEPRCFSVSSSPDVHPNEIHLTVGVLQYRTNDGRLHDGLCTTWLENLGQNNNTTTIPCAIKLHKTFQLPHDAGVPVLMLGIGTGIAPFRGFWQHRYYQMIHPMPGIKFGPMTLFHGCRQKGVDDLYSQEISLMQESKVLTSVHYAYSRMPGQPRIYIQHLLCEQAQTTYEQLVVQEGHIYICGSITMAMDVRKTLLNILCEEGNMTTDKAQNYMELLRKSGRYHEELFGLGYPHHRLNHIK